MYSPGTPLSALLRMCMRRPILFLVPLIFGLIVTGTFDKAPAANKAYRELCPYGCYAIPVTFTFDDNYASQYDEAFPIMKKVDAEYGSHIGASFYIITDEVGKTDRMTLAEIQELYAYGYEIGSHTVHHPDLATVSAADLTDELTDSKKWLEDKGFEVYTMAAPYGSYNDSVLDAMKPLYYGNRTVDEGLNDIPLADPQTDAYKLKTVLFQGDMTLEEAKSWVDKAFAEHKWLIFTLHRVTDPDTVSVDARPFTTDPADLEALLRYVMEKSKEYDLRAPTAMPTMLPTVVPLPFGN